MLVTSKEANKLLQQLQTEEENILDKESKVCTFLAAVGEDVESCRPAYDYEKTQAQLKEIREKIIKVKHSINRFNTETVVGGINKTIDEMLVYIPLLTSQKNRLGNMRNKMPKARELFNMRSTIIDYRYTNYDVNKVNDDYNEVCDELARAQIALDKVNVTNKFEIDI